MDVGILLVFQNYRGQGRDYPILSTRRELLGDYELSCIVDYGGLPWDEVEKSLRLFGAEVLPEVCTW